ncbi:MAG: metal ABC transporter ATP-binding protein [Acidimicrobiia bacterium]|nr:metal ABC transporter ATP-binding protein [Acidimicrobiia bacterium]MDH5237183.1 metal ABC transporter ATP-binding protein [Acidimicrobiia bacterium]
MEPLLTVSNLRVTFGTRIALDGVGFTLAAGHSAALIGPNGSGKTTLLHAIAGLHRPARGTIVLTPADATVAYVTQRHDHARWMPLTASEVLNMAGYQRRGLLGRLTSADVAARAQAADRLAIGDLLRRQFGELSGGQQQRVLIAQALAQQPRLLLLDEPITGLDLVSQQVILDVIADATAAGTAVMLSTHHLDEARHCERVLLLATDLVAEGPPDEVLTTERLREAFGGRLLGDHADHDHDLDLLLLDDHGHGTHG